MARFHGTVGFLIEEDDQTTGIVRKTVVEKSYFGRVIEHSRKWQSSDSATDDVVLANQIAITANDYAFEHATTLAYVTYMGGRWKVTGIRIKRPEIILTLGGIYNGPRPNS